ncbi:hypothetical protein NGF50_04060 [Mammaliicoccus sciuri]|uniref:hypothetical protein n=1 Tax=Mammaliicoccus sciuri TaxID=1296 RepID=UPI002DBAF88B|nr:hypothetical protein [Mammaliicoccus sciuri]MEB7436567.1 hypothetical protein [Mammaliicoccus sciuri]MEB8294534.1 hypothetical protein [Mammaliicoccus sciuri]
MKKTIEKLLNSDINSQVIATKSNVNYSIIHRLRSGERKVGNLKLDTAEKIYRFANTPYDAEVSYEYNSGGQDVLSISNLTLINEDDEYIDLQRLVNTPIIVQEDQDGNIMKERTQIIKELLAKNGYFNVQEINEINYE